MEPKPRTPAFYQEYLAKRWAEGCRHGRNLLKEIQALGYTGCFSCLGQVSGTVAETPSPPVASVTTAARQRRTDRSCDQLLLIMSAHLSLVAAAILGKLRSQMTIEPWNTVDGLKRACPGYAVLRSLVMSSRSILRTGKIETCTRVIIEVK